MNAIRKQIRSLLEVEPREGGFRAVFHISPALSVLPDHFPGFPLLPGICMMQAVLQAGAVRQGVDDLTLHTVKNAKMMQPVLPGEQIIIDGEITPGSDGDIMIKAKLSAGEKRYAEFSLLARNSTIASGVAL